MIPTCRAVMRIIALVSVHLVCAKAMAADLPVDAELLERGATTHQANIDSIRTWSGRVMRTAYAASDDGQPNSTTTRTVTYVEFSYSSITKESLWVWNDRVEDFRVEGDHTGRVLGEPVYVALRNGLVKNGAFYHSSTRMVPSSPEPRSSVSQFWVDSLDAVDDKKPMGWDFDPTNWFVAAGKSLPVRWRSVRDALIRGEKFDFSVTREGERLSLVLGNPGKSNRTTIDLSQGGLIIADVSESEGVAVRWNCENVQVAGVWVPKEITYELSNATSEAARKVFRTKWTWLENRINEPLPEGEFSLVRLGAKRGDIVTDARTATNVVLIGSEYPAPVDVQPEKRGTTVFFLGTVTAVLVAMLCAVLLRRHFAKREALS